MEGSLRTRKWQGQDGQDRYTTEIVASEMQMLDSRGGSTGYDNPAPAQQSAPQAQGSQQQPNQQPNQQSSSTTSAPDAGFDSFDDDIPF